MWVVLLFSAVCITIVAVRLFFALKPAHSAPVRKELDDTRTAAASAGQAVSSRATADTLPGVGALQDQKTPREEQAVPANTRGSLLGADARGRTGVEVAAAPAVSTDTNREESARKGLWVDSHYCWVVLCKNHWFHLRQNLFFRHRIPLAETDPLAPRPSFDGPFRVRCDDCRKEYLYKPSAVLRFEQELPDFFTPHPLFRDY